MKPWDQPGITAFKVNQMGLTVRSSKSINSTVELKYWPLYLANIEST